MEYRGQRYTFDADARLGSGGMAEVYLGVRRDAPQKHVALKIPLPGLHPELRDLFLREAQAAQKVSGPNVVEVVDWGAEPPFIAFEFIEGPTLERVLVARRGDGRYWPEAELIEMYQQLVDAMASINQEVIHRDLKPANIFVAKGLLKVADFGISKYVGEGTRTKTFKGWGTAPYMAPETWGASRSIGARTSTRWGSSSTRWRLSNCRSPAVTKNLSENTSSRDHAASLR